MERGWLVGSESGGVRCSLWRKQMKGGEKRMVSRGRLAICGVEPQDAGRTGGLRGGGTGRPGG